MYNLYSSSHQLILKPEIDLRHQVEEQFECKHKHYDSRLGEKAENRGLQMYPGIDQRPSQLLVALGNKYRS